MFATWGRFVIRFRWVIVLVWIAGVVVGVRALPSLGSVTQTNNAGFLSATAPSQHATALAAPLQGNRGGATATIVAARATGPLTAADETAVDRVERAAATVSGVTGVRDQGLSADGQARRALVTTADSTTGHEKSTVDAIRARFGTVSAPAGLSLHLTGPLAQTADAQAASSNTGSNIRKFTLLFVIVLLFLVYRSLLAPVLTLLPAVAALALAGPLIAKAAQAGMPVSPATQQLLVVLLLGAGTDYGLFLVFRMREEIRGGREPRDALVTAVSRVGESITFSGLTVIAALCCLLLASFGLYRGLGPALAIGIGVLLLAALTLLPASLAIAGRAVFWPSRPAAGQATVGGWGRIAERVVRRPVPVLLAGVLVLGGLAAGMVGFAVGGFTSGVSTAGSDSAAGTATLTAHFPAATTSPETLLLRFATPVWQHPTTITEATRQLGGSPGIHAVTGPLDATGTPIQASRWADLHTLLGPPQSLPATLPAGSHVSAADYRAYRASSGFVSPDGRTVLFDAVPSAGPVGGDAARNAIPALRATLTAVADRVGASDSGVAGQDAAANDIATASTHDLTGIVPVVLAAIAILLAVLLRSLIAPLYLIVTVGLSYVAALGFANILFTHVGGDDGLNFIIPILLFIFAMALGEDYNILLMSRVREEASRSTLRAALSGAIGRTGSTITAAGLILAGTFAVLAIAGNNDQARQLGFTIAFAVILDTFFVRTLLVPSIAVLLGRGNWWPSAMSRPARGQRWALAEATLTLLADHLDRAGTPASTPRLVAAAARLAPADGTDEQRARTAAHTVLRPLAHRATPKAPITGQPAVADVHELLAPLVAALAADLNDPRPPGTVEPRHDDGHH